MEAFLQAVACSNIQSITLLLVLLQMTACILTEPVNVALNKRIWAEIKCGSFGKEVFHYMADFDKSPSDRELLYCDRTDHQPSAMVDGDDATWWQSTSRPNIYAFRNFTENYLEAVITIDLEQEFVIKNLSIQFGDAMRPEWIAIEKSVDTLTYKQWVFRVKSRTACKEVFDVEEEFTPASIAGTICSTYVLSSASLSHELVHFDFSRLDPLLHEWRRAQSLRLKFYKMSLPLGLMGSKFNHYSVSELTIMAECTCNGQQLNCDLNNVTGKYQCVCGGNAEGEFCEKCKPFYNQQHFQYSKPCEACNCFNHSSECYYDATIAAQNKSLNAAGEYSGGGVCLHCQDNTAGINCESCAPLNYLPQGNRKSDPCLPCNCSKTGVVIHPTTGLMGDCFLGNEADQSNQTSGMQAGDCYCKQNVQSAKCDQCKPGFYNPRTINILGCQNCTCDMAGSTGSVCSPDAVGQCPCKTNAQNRQCNECKVGFYGLATNKTDGCDPCGCNKGGAVISTCDKVTGVCICRSNIEGRQCDRPKAKFYYPDLHFISGQFEKLRVNHEADIAGFKGTGYSVIHKNETSSATLTFLVALPLSEKYYLVVRYRADSQATGVVQVPQFGVTPADTITFTPCPDSWCYARISNDKNFTLYAGQQEVIVQLLDDITVNLDQVVAIPVEFLDSPVVNDTTFYTDCDVISNSMKLGTAEEEKCKTGVFTLTTFNLNGVQPCYCHVLGSLNMTCESYGGQCNCRPGVTGRRCDKCVTGNYGLTSEGCKLCNCLGVDQFCDGITGQCICPNNTIGRACDMCSLYHWDWNSQTGCKPCSCNSTGSVGLQCNETSGACLCKLGVAGDNCDTCEPGYKAFSNSGCTPCNCNLDGSVDVLCDNSTSQCTCKNNTEGLLCDSCRTASFYLSSSHEMGCLDCICMGITSSCVSAPYKLTQSTMLLVKEENKTRVSKLVLNDLSTKFDANITVIEKLGAISLTASIRPAIPLYWDIQDLTGNQLVLYRSSLQFDVSASVTDPLKASPDVKPKAVLIGRGGTIALQHSLPAWVNVSQSFTLIFDDQQWTEGGLDVSRGRYLLALSDIQQILLPASLYNDEQTVGIKRILYTMASSQVIFGQQAKSVEKCSCGLEYVGLSCENCAPGYKRANVSTHDYLGVCVPCECNSHATTCDSDTGECTECQDNTEGFSCEICLSGYFGNATLGTPRDCTPCPCYEPRVNNSTCTNDNGTTSCLYCREGYQGDLCDSCQNFYYGHPKIMFTGTCDKCDCTNNSDSCNSQTGECLNCLHNTTGLHCDQCQTGTYGNATDHVCNDCNCMQNGSSSMLCDRQTGQCSCYPNVSGRTCDYCLTAFYGYTIATYLGCVSCNCNEQGSADLQCDNITGICDCKDGGVIGDKCDACDIGFWGLPIKVCQPCDCNAIGSVNASSSCDTVTGQCLCKAGVSGQMCDQCEAMYTNFTEQGCEPCDECPFALGNDTLKMNTVLESHKNDSLAVRDMQDLDLILQQTQDDLNSTVTGMGVSEKTLQSMDTYVDGISVLSWQANQQIKELHNQVFAFNSSTSLLLVDAQAEHDKLANLSGRLQAALIELEKVRDAGMLNMTQLTTYNSSAQKLIGQELNPQGIDADFHEELLRTEQGMEAIKITTATAQSMQTEMAIQKAEAERLQEMSQTIRSQLSTHQDDTGQFQAQIYSLDLQVNEVLAKIQDAIAKKDALNTLVNDTQILLDGAESIIVENRANFAQASTDLTDCDIILDGSTTGVLPIDNAYLPTLGITSWTSAADQLQQQTMEKRTTMNTLTDRLSQAVQTSEDLKQIADQLEEKFQSVEGLGQDAVDAITNYESVTRTLNTSLELAKQANTTVKEAQNLLDQITVMDLATQAQESKALSEQQRTEVSSVNYEATVLSSRLDSAQSGINLALNQWEAVKSELQDLNSTVQAMQNNSAIGDTEAGIAVTRQKIDNVNSMADLIKTRNDDLSATLDQDAILLNTLQTDTVNSSKSSKSIENQLKYLQDDLSTVQRRVNFIEDIRTNSMAELKIQITGQLADLETQIRRAQAAASKLNQPLQFNGSSLVALTNPSVSGPSLYNYISVDFKKTVGVTDALLAFVENAETGAEFSVLLDAGSVVFEYNIDVDHVRINNPAVICESCWFRVLASRYANRGTLTVTLLSTMGSVTTTKQGAFITERHMSLTSKIFVGGLPLTYQTIKVDKPNFSGCMYNVKYQGQTMNIWQKVLELGGDPKCCTGPQDPIMPTLVSGVRFEGFGYLDFNENNMAIQTNSRVYFQFRTFASSGNMFLVTNASVKKKYSVGLRDGKLVFEYGAEGNLNGVQTDSNYNNGVWYKVTVQHSQTRGQLIVQFLNQTDGETLESKSVMTEFTDLTDLAGLDIVLGSFVHPQTIIYQEHVNVFAGCIADLRYDLYTGLQLMPRSMEDGITRQKNIQLTGCLPSVISGMGFSGPTSFLSIDGTKDFNPLRSISFSFMTSEPHGILVHAKDSVFSDTYLHICLFHGNVFLFYNQRQDTAKQPVFTSGEHFNDGQLHTVQVEFSVSGTSLVVDGKATESPETPRSNGLKFQQASSSPVYVGGVNEGSTLLSSFPTKKSLVGGIKLLTFNDRQVDIFENGVILQQENIYLSGLAPPTGVVPLPPYSTTAPPPITPPPTCSPVSTPEFLPLSEGIMFGNTPTSYERFSYDINLFAKLLENFVLMMEVKAFAANGILFYIADNYVKPNFWFALYMEKGHFVVSMQASVYESATHKVVSKQKHNHGEWVKVAVLRNNNFIAIMNTNSRDYTNNALPSSIVSELPLSTDIYVGGVDSRIQAEGLLGVPFGKVSFVGGIRNVIINAVLEEYPLNLRDPAGSEGTGALYKQAWYGVSLSGDRSYLRIVDGFSMFSSLEVKLIIRSKSAAANLFLLYQSPQKFVTLDIMDGKIRCIVGNINVAQPFISVNQDLINICDTQQQFEINVFIDSVGIKLQINDHAQQSFDFPVGFKVPQINSQSVFIGGLQDPSLTFPQPVSTNSFAGCLQSVIIQGTEYEPRDAVMSSGVIQACSY